MSFMVALMGSHEYQCTSSVLLPIPLKKFENTLWKLLQPMAFLDGFGQIWVVKTLVLPSTCGPNHVMVWKRQE